ncbi:MAG: alpha/beta hydrolase [Opitutae bacterium]
MKLFRHLWVALGLICLSGSLRGAALGDRGSFLFTQGGHQLKVWHYRPAAALADAPVLFVLHGVGRNAEDYLNDWIEQADQYKFLLVVPEFSKAEFPGEEAYNSGNLFDAAGRLRPQSEWSFSMIEPIFDRVRTELGSRRADYLIYGHSAGAQFVHRFLYFVPEARVTRAVAANAGWYMLPELGTDFPYGLKGAPADEAALRTALARPLVVLLGESDTDSEHVSLRHTPGADAQGLYRFARGQYFFAHAQATARALAAPCHWSLVTVPGIAHVNKAMAPFAARQLFPE